MVHRHPLNIGHRGARGLAPENTLAGFRAAVDAGADGVEFDVQRTLDGRLVIFHDDDLQRITGAQGRVVESPLARLRELEAGSHFDARFAGEPIPTLDQVIESLPADCFLNIEAKRQTLRSDGLERGIIDAVRRHDLYNRCLISSFNPTILWRIGRRDPRLDLGLLYESDMPLGLSRAWPRYFIRLAALHPHHGMVTTSLVRRAHGKGIQINTWTVNEPDDMRRLITAGVDAIITDRPDLLADVLIGR